jgi:hypothetical protein
MFEGVKCTIVLQPVTKRLKICNTTLLDNRKSREKELFKSLCDIELPFQVLKPHSADCSLSRGHEALGGGGVYFGADKESAAGARQGTDLE